jgi:cytochrome c oxidase assembly protein subunit 15
MITVLIYSFKSYSSNNDLKTKRIAIFLSCVVCFQFLLGIVTLINMVPVYLGALHQTGALILFIGFTISMHRNNMDVKTN